MSELVSTEEIKDLDEAVAALEDEVKRLRGALVEAAPQLATIAGELEPYHDQDGWGDDITVDDIQIWASVQAIADNLAFALDPPKSDTESEVQHGVDHRTKVEFTRNSSTDRNG